jgi:kinesin family protein C1
MGTREEEEEPRQADQKKGMKVSACFQQPPLRYQKSRKTGPQQSAGSQARKESRDFSGLRKRFEDLSLDEDQNDSCNGDQAVSSQHKQPPPRHSQSDVQTEVCLSKVHQEEAAGSDPFGPADSQRVTPLPTTPQKIELARKALERVEMSLRKDPLSPTKPCSPTKRPFLTKDSNLTNFVGFDVDGRLNDFEREFKVMKEAFEGTLTDRKAMEEAISLAKNRGR